MSLIPAKDNPLHRKIENDLILQLNYLVEIIKKDNEITKSSIPVLQERYNSIIEDIIRPSIQRIYLDVAEDVANKNFLSFYFTVSDIETIKELTERFKQEFWFKINKLLERLTSDILIPKKGKLTITYSPLSPLNENYMVTSLAVDIVVISRAEILQQKVNEVKETLGTINTDSVPRIREAALQLPSFLTSIETFLRRLISPSPQLPPPAVIAPPVEDSGLFTQISSSLRQLFAPPKKREFYRWLTARDERVCFICAPLHNTIYEIDETFIPTPISDTHPNCRCELEYNVEYL